ncbi:hypothetical protein DPMN_044233 [Dreissena polymorpha]|uniref:Uncharacterized protein n=1 Tax=Dreissena polymorpha TaxID=45954 RepID=A0A9D4D2V4_DREPO|nr:hypothetical protein DPMN_044233 [Dreissena polymorpha]
MLRDRVTDLEYSMDTSEQYSSRNNVRIFEMPYSTDSNLAHTTKGQLCKTSGCVHQ